MMMAMMAMMMMMMRRSKQKQDVIMSDNYFDIHIGRGLAGGREGGLAPHPNLYTGKD